MARGANVQTANGTVSRPLQKMYPLEVEDDGEDSKYEDGESKRKVSLSKYPEIPPTLSTSTVHTPPFSHLPHTPPTGAARRSGSTRNDYSGAVEIKDDKLMKQKADESYATTSSRPRRLAGLKGETKRRIESFSTGGRC